MCEIVDEALCQQSTIIIASFAVTALTESPSVFVAVAASEKVQSTSVSVKKNRNKESESKACA